jgi:hypothetical protein
MNDHLHERARPTPPVRTTAAGGDVATAIAECGRQVDDGHAVELTGERRAVEHAGGGCLRGAGESQYVAPPAEGRPAPDPPTGDGSACGDATAPDLLTVAQVMARLQVGRHTVYDLIRTRDSGLS